VPEGKITISGGTVGAFHTGHGNVSDVSVVAQSNPDSEELVSLLEKLSRQLDDLPPYERDRARAEYNEVGRQLAAPDATERQDRLGAALVRLREVVVGVEPLVNLVTALAGAAGVILN